MAKHKNLLFIIILLVLFTTALSAQQVDWFSFTKDYFPGTRDANGQYLSGTELMRLTTHKGKLYASTSTFLDSFFVARYPYYTGAQILRKDSSRGAWQADLTLGLEYLRADCLESIRFTHDSTGATLPAPVDILVAGIWDVAFNRQKMVSVAIRNDIENRWIVSAIDTNADNDQGSVRSMIVYRDKVTGIQYLFIGAGVGSMYKGVYDPSTETGIRWVGGNEFDFDAGRVQCMTVCNDTLYAVCGYGDSQSQGDQGGLFKRVDGVDPRWDLVYGWEHNPQGKFEYLLRGISAVPDPDNPARQVIVGALEKPPLPVIRRIDPANGYAATEEVNYEEYFARIFGATPNPKQYMNGAILNKLEPFTHPASGEPVHLVTTFIMHPQSPAAGFNGAYFMVRYNDGRYEWGAIADSSHLPDGTELQGVRTIEKSPFPDEPDVYYFGGYAADYENVKNTAWIYKAALRKATSVERTPAIMRFDLYPNPMSSTFTMRVSEPTDARIIDILGRMAWSGKIESSITVDASGWTPGLYFLIHAGGGLPLLRR